MSGGYFEYNQYRLHDIAQAIKELIASNEREYSDETLAEFEKAVQCLQVAETYAQRIDWLVCDDDSEESFHRRLKKELAEINGERDENR